MSRSIALAGEFDSAVEWLVKLRLESSRLAAHAERMAQDLGGNKRELEAIARSKAQILDLTDRLTEMVCTWQTIQVALNPMGRPPKLLDTLKERVIEYQTIIDQMEGERK